MSLQAAAENGQRVSSSYGDREVVPLLWSEGGETPREPVARLAGLRYSVLVEAV